MMQRGQRGVILIAIFSALSLSAHSAEYLVASLCDEAPLRATKHPLALSVVSTVDSVDNTSEVGSVLLSTDAFSNMLLGWEYFPEKRWLAFWLSGRGGVGSSLVVSIDTARIVHTIEMPLSSRDAVLLSDPRTGKVEILRVERRGQEPLTDAADLDTGLMTHKAASSIAWKNVRLFGKTYATENKSSTLRGFLDPATQGVGVTIGEQRVPLAFAPLPIMGKGEERPGIMEGTLMCNDSRWSVLRFIGTHEGSVAYYIHDDVERAWKVIDLPGAFSCVAMYPGWLCLQEAISESSSGTAHVIVPSGRFVFYELASERKIDWGTSASTRVLSVINGDVIFTDGNEMFATHIDTNGIRATRSILKRPNLVNAIVVAPIKSSGD